MYVDLKKYPEAVVRKMKMKMKSSLRGKMNSSGPMETITRQRASRYVQK
jgi:hypothetical protein